MSSDPSIEGSVGAIDTNPDGEPSGQSTHKATAVRSAALLSFRQILVGLVTVIGIVTLPRLLTPAEFSLYGYVNTVILVGAALGDLGLGAVIIKNRVSDRDMSGILAIQMAFWFATCLALLGLSTLIDPFGFGSVTTALLVLGLLLFSLQALPTAVLEKRMRFKQISLIEVIQRVILVGVAVGFAAAQPAQWTIPLAAAIAAVVGFPMVMVAARWRWLPRFKRGEPLFRGFASDWWQVRIASQAAYATYPLLGGLLFTTHEVGLIVWALAVTSIPAYLAPMVARAIFPALSRSPVEEHAGIYSTLLRGLLVIGCPLAAALFVGAEAFTEVVFGSAWVDGVTLLRLESVTTVMGIASSSVVPVLFLNNSPTQVKWICVGNTVLIVLLSVALAPLASYLAISLATVASGAIMLVLFDGLLRKSLSYSLIRDMAPALVGFLLAIAIGSLLIAWLGGSVVDGLIAGFVAAIVQVAITYLLKGGVSPRAAISRIRPTQRIG